MAKSSHRTLSVAVACAKPFAQSSNFGGEPVPVQRVLAEQFETSSTLFFMIGTQTLGSSYGRIRSGDFSAKPTDAVGPQGLTNMSWSARSTRFTGVRRTASP